MKHNVQLTSDRGSYTFFRKYTIKKTGRVDQLWVSLTSPHRKLKKSFTWISVPIWKDFKDTTDYLNKTQFSDISEENVFVTMYITSLYINNPYQKGIGRGDNNNPYTFHKILSWTIWPCFNLNTFMIKGNLYTQT